MAELASDSDIRRRHEELADLHARRGFDRDGMADHGAELPA
jgi:hypothetical protein